jgi:hypothetical protein
MKDQKIRLLDVFVIGPMMIRSGWLERDSIWGKLMLLAGTATIVYNYQNYREAQRSVAPRAA